MALAVVIFQSYIDRKPLLQLGFQMKGQAANMMTGLLAALFILSQAIWVLDITGMVTFTSVNFGDFEMIRNLLTMLLVAAGEEMLFRGYIQGNLQNVLPKWLALILSSIIFMLAHLNNPSQQWLSMPGIFAGGIILGVNYLFTRNLWFSILFHWTWNFLLGPVMGFGVSGVNIQSLFTNQLSGDYWITGGAFVPEASTIVILLNLLTAGWLWMQYSKRSYR
jgi:uncharacterized protein